MINKYLPLQKMTTLQKYISALQKIDLQQATEHSLRFELKTLLEDAVQRKVDILHEGKREGKFGSPDFKISDNKGIIGYVETKKLDFNLDKILHSEQIKKYTLLSNNLLITNYLEFIWIRNGKIELRETICTLKDLESQQKDLFISDKTINLIQQFLKENPVGINNAKELAHALATRTKILKEFLKDALQNQTDNKAQTTLLALYKTFQSTVSADLTISEFVDAFAQMLSYGIFLAKLNADTKEINLYTAKQFIPKSFELIQELVGFLDKLEYTEYQDTRWIVEEIITILNHIDVNSIRESLSFNRNRNPNKATVADPYLYFYEEFLSVYDSKLRKSKGVYYTPPEIVNFIIRCAGQLLENEFAINQQFADKNKVTVLDFATGTGTFILEILKQIFETIPANSTKREIIIQEHILKNIFGFEYLIAPYTIAHLKLSQFLRDNDYEMQSNERLQIYLTNTIEPLNTQYNAFVQALSKEGETAQKIKEKPILVITGNPPYSVSSTNKSKFILTLLDDYKKGLNERRINLDDDYIKFIRFAHNKIDKVGKGIVAIITNNSYLEGVTHRKMREKIFADFDKIFVINLHGNTLKKETDENIFDIRVGVSILLLVRLEKRLIQKEIFYFSTFENKLISRKEKYDYFANIALNSIPFIKLNPTEPYFWFTNKDLSLQNNYNNFISISSIFKTFGSGVSTLRDNICVHFTKPELENILDDFEKLSTEKLSKKYNVKDSRDWTMERAKNDIIKNKNTGKITEIHYRPFDKRYTFYTGTSRGFIGMPQKNIANNLLNKINYALIFPRYIVGEFNHCFVVNCMGEYSLGGIHTASETNLAPLYLYSENTSNGNGLFFEKEEGRQLNFTENFKSFIKQQYDNQYTAEEIFYYIYAILHSAIYREKYVEFFRIDFPKIPFTTDNQIFTLLSIVGKKIIDAHIFKEIPNQKVGLSMGKGSREISKIQYISNKLYYNETNYFDNISEQVFNYKIGGYQVVERFLKERKHRKLENNEIETLENIINVIDFTVNQINTIDELTKKWI